MTENDDVPIKACAAWHDWGITYIRHPPMEIMYCYSNVSHSINKSLQCERHTRAANYQSQHTTRQHL